MSEDKRPRWLALESNPASYNKWADSLGLDTTQWKFEECLGLDPETLSWIAQPVKAVVALIPAYFKLRETEDPLVELEGYDVPGTEDLLWFPQTIGNACGTYALIHTLANSQIPLEPLSPLISLFEQARSLPTAKRSDLLLNCKALAETHVEVATVGTSSVVPPLEAKVGHHFVTFVERNGLLIELEGVRKGPLCRGKIKEGLLLDTAAYMRTLVAKSSGSIEFSLIALSPA
ncbi:cysteine proteinase [Meredithblackwellia eburnea MCA 4105]